MRKYLAASLAFCFIGLAFVGHGRAQLMMMTGAGKGAVAAAGCGAFPTLTGLLGDYRANLGVTGSPVTAVANQASGGSFGLTNTNTVPFNATSAYNSKPAFDFAFANDGALKATSFGIGTGSDASVFVVGRMNVATVSFGGAVSYGVTGSDFNTAGNSALITRESTNANIQTTDVTTGSITNAMSTGANHRFGTIYALNGGSPTKTQYVDNVAGGVTGSSAITFVNSGTFVIGNRFLTGAVGGAAWDGPVLHVVIANAAFTLTERNNLDTWFTCTYGS